MCQYFSEKLSNIVKAVERLLQPLFLTKKYEAAFGESYFAAFSNEKGRFVMSF